jgi:hypothetical protein
MRSNPPEVARHLDTISWITLEDSALIHLSIHVRHKLVKHAYYINITPCDIFFCSHS